MSLSDSNTMRRPNGAGAAALLAAGIGCFALGVLAAAADLFPPVKKAMVFYAPTGALSGVTTVALIVWTLCWVLLHALWRRKDLRLGGVSATAFVLLALALLLTFPPFVDLL